MARCMIEGKAAIMFQLHLNKKVVSEILGKFTF